MMKLLTALLVGLTISVFPQNVKQVKVLINSNFDLEKLASTSLDLEHSIRNKEDGSIEIFVDEAELSEIEAVGLGYTVLIDDWEYYYNSLPVLNELEREQVKIQSNAEFGVSGFDFGSMGGYYTFDEIISNLDEMFQLYPNLVTEKFSIGTSVEGRTIWAVKISDNPNISEDEPSVGFDALVHAREPQSMATLMYFMWYLLENYGTDPGVTYLIDNREIYCIPCFNPDGYEYNRQTNPNGGGSWRKNRRDNGGCYGVDLNRNFGYEWGYDNIGSSPNPCDGTYRGPSAFSEPEAQAVRDFATLHDYGTHFNMHSYGDAYLYPWGYNGLNTPDSLTYREFAGDMSTLNGYEYGTGVEVLGYPSNGAVRDWMYGEQTEKNKIFSYTIEIGPAFWPSQSQIFPIAQQNVKSNMYHAFVAGEYVKLSNPKFSKEYFLPNDFITLLPEFKNKGLATAYNLEFELGSSSQYITVNTSSASLDSLQARSSFTLTSALSFTISNSAPLEEEIPVIITTRSNGSFMSSDTVQIVIGFPVMIFEDPNDDPDVLWTITATPITPKWEATFNTYYSEPTSFTDSKVGNYKNNATVTMTLTDPININSLVNPRLRFRTKFNIESNYDYGQVEISTNGGGSWIPLEGEYTEPGVSPQPNGQPVYDGVINNWVKEEIILSSYLSDQFKIRFQLITDGGLTRDGWYVDDISVFIYTIPTTEEGVTKSVTEYSLEQNYPNPFNPSTTINWQLVEDKFVTLKIFDVLGNEVTTLINREMEAGRHNITFNASDLSSGIYYYKINAGIFSETKKMLLLK